MGDLMNALFGPLPSVWCLYFYYLSIIFYILFVVAIISSIWFMVSQSKRVTYSFMANTLMIWVNLGLAYISYRLLHTMCINSTNKY